MDRYKTITTGRAGKLRELAQGLVANADRLPTKSELREALEGLYPGDDNAAVRADLSKRLATVAEKAQNRRNRFVLRQVVDELVFQTETKLADEDRLVPAPETGEDVDVEGLLEQVAIDEAGGELNLREKRETSEAYNEAYRIRSLRGDS